jgi:hypothetical protein
LQTSADLVLSEFVCEFEEEETCSGCLCPHDTLCCLAAACPRLVSPLTALRARVFRRDVQRASLLGRV